MGSIPGSGRSPAGGHGNPLQYFFVLLRRYASFLAILSLCCCVGNSLQLRCAGPSLRRPPQLWGTEFQAHGFSRFSSRGPRGQALCLWHTGTAAPQHVGPSWIRDRASGPCSARRTPHHWTPKEVPRSSTPAWRTPRTGEPGGLWSIGSKRVRHD